MMSMTRRTEAATIRFTATIDVSTLVRLPTASSRLLPLARAPHEISDIWYDVTPDDQCVPWTLAGPCGVAKVDLGWVNIPCRHQRSRSSLIMLGWGCPQIG